MARQSGTSLFGSLRGKIWVSTSVLAFFICTFGLISYLLVSLLINDPFFGVFIPFLALAFVVMLFGWWLSNEVVNPVERLILLAKSLERSSSATVPRTSGSTETDQLLETIQRNNQQMQNIVNLMDKVANGNLDVAPMQGTDRLSVSFQKLLGKVSESIHAKEELDELNRAIDELKMDVSGVRSGNLDATVKNEYAQTRELSETFKYLIDNLSRLITSVRNGAEGAEAAVKRVDGDIQDLIQRDEVRVQDMSQASIALKQVPNLINKITEDLMGSAKSARQSIEKARHGNAIANQNSSSVSNLRKQVREDVKRIQSLNERSHEIEKVAKTVEDLASRTNMIALNASIQATEMGEEGHGFVLVAEEVERLAARANGTNKQISTLNKSILAEIGKVESSVETTMTEVASLSKYAIETGNVLGEMERYVAHFLNLQENLIAYSKDQSEETDKAFKTFAESISETESTIELLKDSTAELSSVARLVRDLNLSVGEFRLPEKTQLSNSRVSENLEPDTFHDEGAEEEKHTETSPPAYASNTFAPDGSESDDYGDLSDPLGDFKQEPVTPEEFVSTEQEDSAGPLDLSTVAVPESDKDRSEPVSDNYEEDADLDENSPYSAENQEGDDIEEEYSANFHRNPEIESDYSDDSYENGVLDLYNASYAADSESTNFDSGEFISDEMIDESGPEDQIEGEGYSAAETNVIDTDELEDLLETGPYNHPSPDNELAVENR